MFKKTSWDEAPWVILKGNDKDMARLEGMRFVLSRLDYKDKGQTAERLEADEDIVTISK